MKKRTWEKYLSGSAFLLTILGSLPPTLQAESAASSALATINGRNITETDLLNMSNKQLVRNLQNQLYLARRQALDSFIVDELIDQTAKAQSLSREQLIRQEVDAKVSPATEAQVKEFYETNKARLGGKSLDETKTAISSHLQTQSRQTLYKDFIAKLRKEADVKMLLQPPPLDISLTGAPVRGPTHAPVTIVEFSDFQ
ncbi:MAG: hypothetical protein AB7G75_27360 [Candidatus Binatia bacterium]